MLGKFLFGPDVRLHWNNLSSIKRLVQSRCFKDRQLVGGDRGRGSLANSGVNLVMCDHREV